MFFFSQATNILIPSGIEYERAIAIAHDIIWRQSWRRIPIKRNVFLWNEKCKKLSSTCYLESACISYNRYCWYEHPNWMVYDHSYLLFRANAKAWWCLIPNDRCSLILWKKDPTLLQLVEWRLIGVQVCCSWRGIANLPKNEQSNINNVVMWFQGYGTYDYKKKKFNSPWSHYHLQYD